jgi:hypothetical protein
MMPQPDTIPVLVGTCNRCGLCCFVGPYRCSHLILAGPPGSPEASACGVYLVRRDRMPIELINDAGDVVGTATCAKNSPEDVLNILEKGIGKGCSLTVAEGGSP